MNAFTDGQKARMYSHFVRFRQGKDCSLKKRSTPLDDGDEGQQLEKRQQDASRASLLADLLLQNCSVAIQEFFAEDSVPLPKTVLASYSSAASSMQANPQTTNTDRPATQTLGTALPSSSTGGTAGTARASSTSRAGAGASGGRDVGGATSPLAAMLWSALGLLLL
jgi:hypothetical protein